MKLSNNLIEISVDASSLEATVVHCESGAAWAFRRAPGAELLIRHGQHSAKARIGDAREIRFLSYRGAADQRLTAHVLGMPGDAALSVTFALPDDEPVLRVEIAPLPTGSASRIADAWFPGSLTPVGHAMEGTLWPNMAGTLIPARYPQAIRMPEGGDSVVALTDYHALNLSATRALYQAWWGLMAERGSCVAIAETDLDFALDLWHPAGGPTHAAPVWLPSLGELAYPRAIRYHFLGHVGHAALAKVYRAWVQRTGRWVGLAEKLDRSPIVRKLIGAVNFPVRVCMRNQKAIPPEVSVTTFEELGRRLDRIHALGIKRAFIHIDGWGFRGYDNHHPDVLPPCPEAGGWDGLRAYAAKAGEYGYLCGLHDQYRDFYHDGPAFQEKRAVKDFKGEIDAYSHWYGGPQSRLCAREALPFVRRTFEELLGRGIPLSASYLDVFAVSRLDECCDSAHPMTRTDCFRWRAEALDYVRGLGLAISSEEPVDPFMPHLDFAHWADVPRWQFMRGEPLGVPVPLHQLVYHDALLLPAVYDNTENPQLRTECFLRGLASVEMPYGQDHWNQARQFEGVQRMAALHAAWALHELLDHRLLDAEGKVQTFIYPEGLVRVDFDQRRYCIEGGACATQGWRAAP